jgi:hypothetical protein
MQVVPDRHHFFIHYIDKIGLSNIIGVRMTLLGGRISWKKIWSAAAVYIAGLAPYIGPKETEKNGV